MPKKKTATATDTGAEAVAQAEDAEAQERRAKHLEAVEAAGNRPQPEMATLRMSEAEAAAVVALLEPVTNGCVDLSAVLKCMDGLRVIPLDRDDRVVASLASRDLPAGETGAVALTIAEACAVVSDVMASPKYWGQDLRKAVGRGQLSTIRELLSRGCNPNKSDAAGRTAAHCAALLGQESALELLRECWGAEDFDFDSPDKSGWTPLAVACAGGFTTIVRLLLEWGADVGATTSCGRTALHVAAATDQADAIPLLAAAGASLDAPDAAGWTAMHLAAVHGAKRSVEALAAVGADAARPDHGGRPAEKLCHVEASLALRKALRRGEEAVSSAAARGSSRF